MFFSPAMVTLTVHRALFYGQARRSPCQQQCFLVLNLKHQADQFWGYVASVFSCFPTTSGAGATQSPCYQPTHLRTLAMPGVGEQRLGDVHGRGTRASGRGTAPLQGCSSPISSSGSILEPCHANCSLVDIHDPFLFPPCVNSVKLGCQEVKIPSPQSLLLFPTLAAGTMLPSPSPHSGSTWWGPQHTAELQHVAASGAGYSAIS